MDLSERRVLMWKYAIVFVSNLFQLEPADRVTEVSAEPLKTPEKSSEGAETDKDTTSQHKSHLFDLHCKICTGKSLHVLIAIANRRVT